MRAAIRRHLHVAAARDSSVGVRLVAAASQNAVHRTARRRPRRRSQRKRVRSARRRRIGIHDGRVCASRSPAPAPAAVSRRSHARVFRSIHRIASDAVTRWRPGVPFAMNRETQKMTLQAIIRAVFGVDTGNGQSSELVAALTDFANHAVASRCFRATAAARLGTVEPLGAHRQAQGTQRRRDPSRDSGPPALEQRGRSRGHPSLLLQVRYEDGTPLTDQQVRDELVVMLMAGHETTGTAPRGHSSGSFRCPRSSGESAKS